MLGGLFYLLWAVFINDIRLYFSLLFDKVKTNNKVENEVNIEHYEIIK